MHTPFLYFSEKMGNGITWQIRHLQIILGKKKKKKKNEKKKCDWYLLDSPQCENSNEYAQITFLILFIYFLYIIFKLLLVIKKKQQKKQNTLTTLDRPQKITLTHHINKHILSGLLTQMAVPVGWEWAVIYLQFYTCVSQDSLGLYKVSPTRKSLRPLQNFPL